MNVTYISDEDYQRLGRETSPETRSRRIAWSVRMRWAALWLR